MLLGNEVAIKKVAYAGSYKLIMRNADKLLDGTTETGHF